jgi:hypothetical protein
MARIAGWLHSHSATILTLWQAQSVKNGIKMCCVAQVKRGH